ncbi:DUF362 domain-containing protein [Candidatus Bathyarchaeota archaeon]|nr:DUF362 domain-containing protein [Candidatus Bathyarchaeota archaeon]
MSVSVIKELEDRRRGVRRSLNLIKENVRRKLPGRARILIKPNFVSAYNPPSATPVECVDEILKFLLALADPKEIIVSESPTIGSFGEAVRRYGYMGLKDKYNVEICDLDEYGHEEVEIADSRGSPLTVPVSKLALESDFRVSPVRPKTHDVAVVTLTIKNMVVGSIKRGYRRLIHQGYWQINYNIARIAVKVMPHLAIVDGYEAMEENGPVHGNLRRWGAYFASINPVSLDSAVAFAMGFNPSDVGYLYLLSKWDHGELNPEKINIIGEGIDAVRTIFKPHRDFRNQISWKKHMDALMKLPKPS